MTLIFTVLQKVNEYDQEMPQSQTDLIKRMYDSNLYSITKVNEYDQEMPQSQTDLIKRMYDSNLYSITKSKRVWPGNFTITDWFDKTYAWLKSVQYYKK